MSKKKINYNIGIVYLPYTIEAIAEKIDSKSFNPSLNIKSRYYSTIFPKKFKRIYKIENIYKIKNPLN